MRLGFFDSGVGGLSVLYEAIKLMPFAEFLYYADTDNVPYGIKPKEEVKKLVFKAVEFLVEKKIDALVVACNTATSIAIKELREKYSIPIIGMEPAIKPAVEKTCNKRVLVFATPLTLIEEKFQQLVTKVDKENIIDYLPLPELVEYAEKFNFDNQLISEYLTMKLKNYDINNYGTIVLGCTHFVFYKQIIASKFPNADIIDGNKGTVNHLYKMLDLVENDIQNSKLKINYYTSGREDFDYDYHQYFEILDKIN